MSSLAPASQSTPTRRFVAKIDVAERTTASPPYRHDFRVSRRTISTDGTFFARAFRNRSSSKAQLQNSIPPVQGIVFSHVYLGFRKSEQDSFDVHTNHLQDKTRQNERAPRLFESNHPFILGGQHVTYSYRRHHNHFPRPLSPTQSAFSANAIPAR